MMRIASRERKRADRDGGRKGRSGYTASAFVSSGTFVISQTV
jgi:hypothetical protein